jgi:hypothetical protein
MFEFTDAKSCILVHSDIKNYLLQTHQCSRKEKDLLQRSSSAWSLWSFTQTGAKNLGDRSPSIPHIQIIREVCISSIHPGLSAHADLRILGALTAFPAGSVAGPLTEKVFLGSAKSTVT